MILKAMSVGRNHWEFCQTAIFRESKLQMNSFLLQPISRFQQLGPKQLERNLKQVKQTNFSFKILPDMQENLSSL